MARRSTAGYPSSRNSSGGIGGVYPALIEPARAEVVFNDLPQLLSFPLQRAKASNSGDGRKYSEAVKVTEDLEPFATLEGDVPTLYGNIINNQIIGLNKEQADYRSGLTSQILEGVPDHMIPDLLAQNNFTETMANNKRVYQGYKDQFESVKNQWKPFSDKVNSDDGFAQSRIIDPNGFISPENKTYRDLWYDYKNNYVGVGDLPEINVLDYKSFNESIDNLFGNINADLFKAIVNYSHENVGKRTINGDHEYNSMQEAIKLYSNPSMFFDTLKEKGKIELFPQEYLVPYDPNQHQEYQIKTIGDRKFVINDIEYQKQTAAINNWWNRTYQDEEIKKVYNNLYSKFFESVLNDGHISINGIKYNVPDLGKEMNVQDWMYLQIDDLGKEKQKEFKNFKNLISNAFNNNLFASERFINKNYDYDAEISTTIVPSEKDYSVLGDNLLKSIFNPKYANSQDFDEFINFESEVEIDTGDYLNPDVLKEYYHQLGLANTRIDGKTNAVRYYDDIEGYLEYYNTPGTPENTLHKEIIQKLTPIVNLRNNETIEDVFNPTKIDRSVYSQIYKRIYDGMWYAKSIRNYNIEGGLEKIINEDNWYDMTVRIKHNGGYFDKYHYSVLQEVNKRRSSGNEKDKNGILVIRDISPDDIYISNINSDGKEEIRMFDKDNWEKQLDNTIDRGLINAKTKMFKIADPKLKEHYNSIFRKGEVIENSELMNHNFYNIKILPTYEHGDHGDFQTRYGDVIKIAGAHPIKLENGVVKYVPIVEQEVIVGEGAEGSLEVWVPGIDGEEGESVLIKDLSDEQRLKLGIIKLVDKKGSYSNKEEFINYKLKIMRPMYELGSRELVSGLDLDEVKRGYKQNKRNINLPVMN